MNTMSKVAQCVVFVCPKHPMCSPCRFRDSRDEDHPQRSCAERIPHLQNVCGQSHRPYMRSWQWHATWQGGNTQTNMHTSLYLLYASIVVHTVLNGTILLDGTQRNDWTIDFQWQHEWLFPKQHDRCIVTLPGEPHLCCTVAVWLGLGHQATWLGLWKHYALGQNSYTVWLQLQTYLRDLSNLN